MMRNVQEISHANNTEEKVADSQLSNAEEEIAVSQENDSAQNVMMSQATDAAGKIVVSHVSSTEENVDASSSSATAGGQAKSYSHRMEDTDDKTSYTSTSHPPTDKRGSQEISTQVKNAIHHKKDRKDTLLYQKTRDYIAPSGKVHNAYKQRLSNHHIEPTPQHKFIPTPARDWSGSKEPYIQGYSAYFDERKVIFKNLNVVVVLGLIHEHAENLNITCQYPGVKKAHPVTPKKHFKSGNLFVTRTKLVIHDFIFWCPFRPLDTVPETVSIVLENAVLLTLPVVVPNKPKKKRDLLICVKAIYTPHEKNYEAIDPVRLVEWVEMNRVLGVEHFTVYIHSLTGDQIHDVLYYYWEKGIMDVNSMAPIDGDDYVQPRGLSVTDCLYSNMYSYHRMVNIDTDEIIIPKHFLTLPELITDLLHKAHHPEKVSDMSFKSKVFYLEGIQSRSIYNKTLMLPYGNTYIPDYKRPKDILSLDRCVKVNSHQCQASVPGSTRIKVLLKDGASYHFKRCATARVQNRPNNCKSAITHGMTDHHRMKVFEKSLLSNFEKVMASLTGNLKLGNN